MVKKDKGKEKIDADEQSKLYNFKELSLKLGELPEYK
ncbi:hypothetical protein ig2599ANME_1319 [groundwater metagenome]